MHLPIIPFESIHSFFAAYGLLFAFGLGVFEEIFFFIPSTMLLVALGFFAISSEVKFWPAFAIAFGELGIVVSLGILMGGIVMYFIVYEGGKPAIMRWGKYVRVRWDDIERLHRAFEARGADKAALFFLRVIPAFPIGIVSIVCGLIRVRFFEFAWITFLGSIPRVGGLALFGWYVGRGYARYEGDVAAFEQYILIAVLIACVAFLWHLRARKRGQRL